MEQKIQAFERKLNFLKSVLCQSQLSSEYFPKLARATNNSWDVKEYTLVLDSLSKEYDNRFKDFKKHNLNLQLAYQPHLVNVNQVLDHLQMELIELKR